MPGYEPWAGPPFIGKRDKLVHATRARLVKLRSDTVGGPYTHVVAWCGLQVSWVRTAWTHTDPVTCLGCHGKAGR